LSFIIDTLFCTLSKNKVIYIQYADKISNSKINTTIIERKLAVVATARNWRTSVKLLSLAE
jgi:uncharacterized protein (DUF1697 family)